MGNCSSFIFELSHRSLVPQIPHLLIMSAESLSSVAPSCDAVQKRNRPLGVAIITGVTLAVGSILLAVGVFFLADTACGATECHGPPPQSIGAFVLLFGSVVVWKGYNTWRGKGWATSVFWTAYGFVSFAASVSIQLTNSDFLFTQLGVISFFFAVFIFPFALLGIPFSLVGLAISALLLWYWRKPHVRAFFGKGQATAGQFETS